MNQLHQLFTLRYPRRFWLASFAIAFVSAVVLGPWLETAPWLVAIPLVMGGLLVALGELLDELSGKPALRSADERNASCRKP